MMKIKRIKEVEILSSKFSIIWDKNTDGGYFDWAEGKILIGIKTIDNDPLYVFQVLSHEILEIILIGLGARFSNGRIQGNYLFNFDHQTFENAIQIHTQTLNKFLQ